MVDMVNRPPHYLVGGIEAIDVIKSRLTKEEYIGYLKGCKLKYDLRYPFKDNPQQDLEKSDWYKHKLLEATRDEDAVNPPAVEAILERFDDEYNILGIYCGISCLSYLVNRTDYGSNYNYTST